MTELEKATAILSAALGAEAPEVAELLTSDEAVSQLTSRLETKFKDLRDQGDQRATKKTRETVEKAFKAAGVDDASFADLSAAIAALESKASAANPAALTPEQALKLPAVVSALNAERLKTEAAAADTEKRMRSELATERETFNKARTEAAMRAEAKSLLKELNPNYVTGKETVQEQRLIDEIVREARGKLDENGGIQLIEEDGSLKPGKLGNGLAKYADFVREKADEVYGLPVSKPRDTTGLTQEQIDAAANATKGFVHYKGPKPNTDTEYETLVNDTGTHSYEARKELKSYWAEQKGQ